MQTTRFLLAAIFLALAVPLARAELATGEEACGSVAAKGGPGDTVGPFDYRNPPHEKLQVVEHHHFNHNVETLRAGQSTVNIGADIDFVLRYFPNHPRALNAMARLAARDKTDRPRGSTYTMACWFDRAVRKAPEDTYVRLLYGIWLAKRGEKDLAREQLRVVADTEDRSPNMTYNLGLAYYEIGEYEKALEAAHEAARQGFPLPGLKGMLSKVGKWTEPPPREADKAPAPDAAPAPESAR